MVGGCATGAPVGETAGDSTGEAPGGLDAPGGPGSPDCHESGALVVGDQQTVIGVTAAELANLVAGSHASTFTWAGAAQTIIHMEVTDVRVFSVRVRARGNGDPPAASTQPCANYARIEAHLTFHTRDGKLDETVRDLTLYGFDLEELRAEFDILAGELGGSYTPALTAQRCYQSSSFHVMFRPDGIAGSMVDTVRVTTCDSDRGGVMPYAAGHWGARWEGF
ncbi:MAG TPA: hypothetical protein VG963_34505 [Polyangiaceae bacterium]|nr:hypothetical protein [Polyangiaceae bacterium]